MTQGPLIVAALQSHQPAILSDWVDLQLRSLSSRPDLISDESLRRQSGEFLAAFSAAVSHSSGAGIAEQGWEGVREMLSRVSAERARHGFTPAETAMFILSLKQPLFARLRTMAKSVDELASETWTATVLIDQLGLFTADTFQKAREGVIARQQSEMLELSTPVVTLWKGVLALPLIGTLDSERTQIVMESLLQRIVETGSTIAILDITGVPTVDTLVAQHLLKTVAAARLMGADCIISGIRPQIAQTIVHLGVDLNSVTTKATLADAFAVALKRLGLTVISEGATRPSARPTGLASSDA